MEKVNEPVAYYVVSNSSSIQIFEVNDEAVLAGGTYEDAEWCEIDYVPSEDEDEEELEAVFKWGEMNIPLNQCMRI